MKLIIASDLHGSAPAVELLMRRIEEHSPDRVLLLGDLLYHGPRNDLPCGYAPKKVLALLNSIANQAIAVRGNCDSEVDQMVLDFPCMADFALIEADGHLLYATHGHLCNKTPDNHPLLKKGDAFLSGHTHLKTLDFLEDVLHVNPGSTSIPKDGSASFGVYDTGTFTLMSLDNSSVWGQAHCK